MTLGDGLRGRDNALNFLRLLFAALVIASHAPSIGGFGEEPLVGGRSLGSWAVGGFFAISGYLICSSRQRLPWQDFAIARMLRIYPAYWVALFAVAVVFAPLGAIVTGTRVDPVGGARFVAMNLAMPVEWAYGDAIVRAARPEAWNSPLWTLTHEMICYIIAGVALSWRRIRRSPTAASACALMAVTLASLTLDGAGIGEGLRAMDLLHLVGFFLGGALLWAVRHRLHVRGSLAAMALAALILVGAADATDELTALPTAYLVLSLGVALPWRIGAARDLSYGLYIFGWPVQTTLYLAGAARLGLHAFLLLSFAVTVPLAWASWELIERPALSLRRRTRGMAMRRSLEGREADRGVEETGRVGVGLQLDAS